MKLLLTLIASGLVGSANPYAAYYFDQTGGLDITQSDRAVRANLPPKACSGNTLKRIGRPSSKVATHWRGTPTSMPHRLQIHNPLRIPNRFTPKWWSPSRHIQTPYQAWTGSRRGADEPRYEQLKAQESPKVIFLVTLPKAC